MFSLLFLSVELLIVLKKKQKQKQNKTKTALFFKLCFLADSYDVSSDLVQTGLSTRNVHYSKIVSTVKQFPSI